MIRPRYGARHNVLRPVEESHHRRVLEIDNQTLSPARSAGGALWRMTPALLFPAGRRQISGAYRLGTDGAARWHVRQPPQICGVDASGIARSEIGSSHKRSTGRRQISGAYRLRTDGAARWHVRQPPQICGVDASGIARIVERAISQNVGFNALENAELLPKGLVQAIGFAVLLLDLLDRDPAGIVRGL